jgi:hypothetical protein
MSVSTYRARPLLDASFPLPLDLPFTGAQAARAGITNYQLRRLRGQQLIRRLIKGVYVAIQTPDSRRLRARALVLVTPQFAVVGDWSANWLHTGQLPAGHHLLPPTVTLLRGEGHDRLRNHLCDSGERRFLDCDLMVVDGLIVTTPLRTAWDLGRLASRDQAIGALDGLLRVGSFTRAELVAGVRRFKGYRGVIQLRALAPLADSRAESPGESVLRLRWLDMGSLLSPTPQVPILTAHGIEVYRIDLGVEEIRYGLEYDGEEHHSDDEDREHDRARRKDLRRRFGWDVEGVRKANVFRRQRDVEAILVDGIQRARRNSSIRNPPD